MEAEMDTAAAEDGADAAAPAASAAAPPAGPPAVVIDSGAYSTKVGFAGQDAPTRCMPSVVAREGERRKYVGDAVSQCADPSGLAFRRPCEKGYVMNWDVTQELWDRAFGAEVLGLDAAAIGERALLVTEPQFNHEPLQDTMDQLVFELYGFKEYHCTTAAMLSDVAHRHTAAGADALASVVVDAGYSFTHAVPIFDATKVNYAVKRVDVGGKILTNYLAELCQHREYNLMDETYLVDQLKQVMCYVSGNFDADMKAARVRGKGNTIRRHFVLPDYRAKNHGYVRGDSSRVWNDARATQPDPELRGPEQEITLNIERFTAPELLFNPSDIGFEQGGVVDAIEQAINALPVDLREPAVGNVSQKSFSDKRRFFAVHFWTICATHAPLWIGGVGGAWGRGAGGYWVSSRTALAATPAAFARPQRRIVLERARRAPTHRARPQNRCVALARSHQTSPAAQLCGPSGVLARPGSAPPRGDGQYRERTHHQPRLNL